MIHSSRMPASISSASRIGHHCAPALPANSSTHTRVRSNKLVFASALLLGFLRIACCACPAPRTNSGAQRVSVRLPKLLSGELSVAEATGNRD